MVMLTGGLRFTGNAWLRLTGPTHDSCLGVSGDTNATCNYAGIVFWGARTNCGTVLDAGGNGDINLTGTVYAPCATYRAHGGGNDPEEWEVRGQLIVGNTLGRAPQGQHKLSAQTALHLSCSCPLFVHSP